MTVEYWEYIGSKRDVPRLVLVHEYKGEKPANPRLDKNVYAQTINLGGFDEVIGKPVGPWGLRFDTSIPREARLRDLWHERLQETDPDTGDPLVAHLWRPFEPRVSMRQRDIDAEVARRVETEAERLLEQKLAERAGGGEEWPEDRPVPPTKTRCPACNLVFDNRGYKGHLQFSTAWGNQTEEHAVALMEFKPKERKREEAMA